MSNGRKLADLMVGTNVVATNVDSDLSTKIISIKTRLDSDDTKLQSLDTAIQAGIQNLADSDLIINQLQAKINSVISNVDSDSSFVQSINTQIDLIKTRLDSDDAKLQQVRTSIASEISATNTDISSIIGRLDSDSSKLQQLDTSIVSVKTRLDSDDAAIQAATTLASATAGSVGVTDSDLKVVADLRNQLDSEIIFVKNLSVSYTSYIYNATAGQTSFTGTDANSATLAYTAGAIQVFLNGIRLEADDYTATDGAAVVLTEGAQLGHQVTIVVPKLESNYTPPATGPDWSSTPTLLNTFIEPTQTQNSSYGQDVAIVGNTAVVGTGASREGAYVYSKSGGSWSYVQTLLPSDTASGDQFGIAVLIAPDESTIIVAAPGQDDNATMAGKVYTFTYSGSTWSQASAFQAPGTLTNYETFGRVMAISPNGNILAIGQPGYDGNSTSNTGRILIYTGSGSSWTFRKSILPTDAASNDQIGNNGIALSDTAVVFGSTNHKWGTSVYHGGAWVWTGSGTSWSQQQKLDFTNRLSQTSNKAFGNSVSINGDIIAVGASGDDDSSSNDNTGAVYVYTRSGTTWSQQARLQHTGAASSHALGVTVRINEDDSDTIFAGATTPDSGSGNTGTGAIFIFKKSGSSWSQINNIANPGYNGSAPAANSGFQYFDVSGTDILIGSSAQQSHPTQTWGTGAVYFYEI